ncbi:DUF2269 domain-containing protein [Pseudarthrobacter sp. S9]|uniref:DUF2269 domain-containing protein n=1 Tax=Pseudarthrobacter sp. S9 TaxID=3418421 RepID=UPI003D0198A2
MIMPPGLRKVGLTAHIASSVGWLGAVTAFLCLAITAVVSPEVQIVRAMDIAMAPFGRFVLVPLSIASLLTGIFQSFGTNWGLLRHYWVLAKLLINVLATAVLLLYMPSIGYLADLAADTTSATTDLHLLRSPSPVLHAGAALALLIVATVLGVYKPRGATPYGQRMQRSPTRALG